MVDKTKGLRSVRKKILLSYSLQMQIFHALDLKKKTDFLSETNDMDSI